MDAAHPTDDLAVFQTQNSAGGLFRRYAQGRLRHFWNRQVLGLLGASVVAIVLAPGLGLTVAALILGGEVLDCWALRQLSRKRGHQGLSPLDRHLAALTGAVQILTLLAALMLCQRASPTPEMGVFIAAFLTGVTINAALVRPYFRAGTDVKLALAGLGAAILLGPQMLTPHQNDGGAYFFAAAMVMLALTCTMFVRQIDRAFARQQGLERAMAERHADLRLSKEDLARSGVINQRLALAARHANDAIVFLDADGGYLWVNEGFTRITGYSADQAIGRLPGELLNAAETSVETLDQLAAARRDQSPIRVEIFNRGRDGRGFWVDTSIIPILDDQGRLLVTLAIEREITEAKAREADLARAHAAAEAAAQAKSRFLANMSHEIRTPMNGVIGVTQLLAETRLTATQRDYVDTVLDSGRALLRMINDILDLSKLQSGKIAPEDLPFDLRATVDGVLRLLHPAAKTKGLDLSLRLAPDLVASHVRGDQGKLRQILINLIGNALKFTETGGIVVDIARQADGLTFRVSDTGIGIAPDRLTTIFDSFTQADDSISRRFGGTGLGLTISAMLAQQMGGAITVESQAGTGSCFALTLPLPDVQPARADDQMLAETLVETLTKTAGLRILVAEDNRTNMMILRKVLTGQVAQVIEAADGQSAVQAWRDHRPDLILMDVSMPVMDGLTATREIRRHGADDGLPRCPILALTASSHLEDREACLRAGFDGFLVKPLRREELLQAIADHVAPPPPNSPPPDIKPVFTPVRPL